MQDANNPQTQPYVVTPDAGEAVWFLGTLMTVKATGATTGGAFGLIEQELPPGFATPTHIHHNEDEPFYVLQGELTFHCGERTLVAGAGSFVFLPRGIAHGFQVTSETPARLLQFNFPAGVEQFFIEAGEPATEGAQPGPPDFGKMMALAAKYHMDILPPDHE
jgi:quercetin dioxygenase-like cupin family protein